MSHGPPAVPAKLDPGQPVGSRETSRSWLLRWIDALLSEPLRRAAPSELARVRVLVGATCTLLVFDLVYMLAHQAPTAHWSWKAPGLGVALGLLGTLALVRRAGSITAAGMLLCASLLWGIASTVALYRNAYTSTHATIMMIPAFAVYLLGPRKGLVITLLTLLLLGLLPPLIWLHLGIDAPAPSPQFLWMIHVASSLAILSIWVVGALHSTARDETQAALERTLKELRDSERKLSSLFENTDDMVCSLDTEGRVLVANTALRQAFARRFGQEPAVGQHLFTRVTLGNQGEWTERFREVLQGRRLKFEVEYPLGGRRMVLETSLGPIPGEDGRPTGMVLLARDITARKEAEFRLGEMHRTLMDVSRQAGMAEIATGVLHNVGNTLNSVNISADLITDGLRKLRVSGLENAAALLQANSTSLDAFLIHDPRGQRLPAYLQELSQQLRREQELLQKEMGSLTEGIEHIKAIISMQQKHARSVGAVEPISVPQLIDEALRLHAISFERLGITIERDYGEVRPIIADRHKLLQILLNLLTNARHALVSSDQNEKRLVIRVRRAPEGEHLLIEVADNGMGISAEHLPRLFTQGFTTKKEGHGFGLHMSALAAEEMQGRLTCTSPGLGQGATFILELPLTSGEAEV